METFLRDLGPEIGDRGPGISGWPEHSRASRALSAVCCLPSAVIGPITVGIPKQVRACGWLSAIGYLLSAVCCRLSILGEIHV